MVREIGFDNDDRIEVSKLQLFIFLVCGILLMAACWFGCRSLYDTLVNHTPVSNIKQGLWMFFAPIIFVASLYMIVLIIDCILTKPYIIILSPTGIDLTWPKTHTIAWRDIKEIKIEITKSRGMKFEHLVIIKHTSKESWFQKYVMPSAVKIFSPLMKGGADTAYEKVVAAFNRYAIKHP